MNYLAKDYASFRQLILDRLAHIMPDWKERHVPDLGITLVELLAYVGDYLSYYQDAVATEAYLDTARQRISVRRHARLVDYVLHEGCNARNWVCVTTDTDMTGDRALKPQSIYFITNVRDAQESTGQFSQRMNCVTCRRIFYEVFEAVVDRPIELIAAHNRIRFYTWGERECCLPRGATSATLIDRPATPPVDTNKATQKQRLLSSNPPSTTTLDKLNLKRGDVLILKRCSVPDWSAADADPTIVMPFA